MKRLLLSFLCCAAVAQASDIELRAVRKGKQVAIPNESALSTNVLAFLASCTVHTDVYQPRSEAEHPEIWTRTLRSDSFIHIKFAEPISMKLPAVSNHGRDDYVVQQIVVRLPEGEWAGPLLVRTRRNVHAFGKYDARALKRVAFEPALGLSSIPPYAGLAKLPSDFE